MHVQYALRNPFSGLLLAFSLLAFSLYFIVLFTITTEKQQMRTGKIYEIEGFHHIYLLHSCFGLSAALLLTLSIWMIFRHYKNGRQKTIYKKFLVCTRDILTIKTIAERDPYKKRANKRKHTHSLKVLEKLRKNSDIKLDIDDVLHIAYMAEDMALATGAAADQILDDFTVAKSKSKSKPGSIKSYIDMEDPADQASVDMDTK
ncbi:unnamed protein product [Bursaphelenchus xylophilus]|uniref:(pine wood nematode) hypothetical protein n=1 Tax=Bursaphelenchus xylophilus TaxID=6326 RepID=A0A1I7S9U0_BURXY|nr:unnamed protein product [Bursaphelenchus xylophilus]CAG9129237.1 unnamed protein product [Bursaphelenchus xylophilus]